MSRPFAFPPEARLKRRYEFLRVQKRGHRVWGSRFIYYIRRGATDRTRIGITASKKVGNAVRRNRIKRWVREVFRQHPHLFPEPLDIVVIAKRGVEDLSYTAIRDEFIDVFTRYAKEPPRDRRSRGRRGRSSSRRNARGARTRDPDDL